MVEEGRRVGRGETPPELGHADVSLSNAGKTCIKSISNLDRASQAVPCEMFPIQALTRATLPDAALLQLKG